MPRQTPPTPSPALLLFALALSGCSAGTAVVEAQVGLDVGVTLSFQTEGRNIFSAGSGSCAAEKGAGCSFVLPAAELAPGWNRLEITTNRRTDAPLEARFFVEDAVYGRDCTATPDRVTGDPADTIFSVECTFAEGFTGSMGSRIMTGGKGQIPAVECLGDLADLSVDLARPLLRGSIPVDVAGRNGRLRRGVPVAIPAPVVQATLQGWASPWFEATLPLTIEAEPGASISVNGAAAQKAVEGRVTQVDVPIAKGANEVVVLITMAGHAPARHVLSIEGRHPDTPLFLDQVYAEPLTTDREFLPLSGRTHPHAKLYLNGRLVDHVNGRFELDALLEEGKNDVQLLAVIESTGGQRARPITRVDIEVNRTASLPVAGGPSTTAAPEARGGLDLSTVAADPWAHLGSTVAFPMRIELIAEKLSLKGECSSRIEGLACTERVSGPVMLGWSVVEAWVCIGESIPVVVNASVCPAAGVGDDVFVAGTVHGALGGRHEGVTRDRPSIDALSAVRLPATQLLSPERQDRYRPQLLLDRRRGKRR